ncbi:MAG: amino acid dehydrogenase [Pseudomonadales bacterium]|nr:amino acid dehydrogenase [Pseudomonadales bacterium]
MFDTIEHARLSELHVKSNKETQLRAIVAIHNTHLGPALGGCRCIEYSSDDNALLDAVRLAKGMSYKAALAHIPQGGGKAVLIKPKAVIDREAYFESFGEFVNELGGRYITAVDSGTSPTDMEFVSHKTSWVSGTPTSGGDPSPFTALGVLQGIKACIQFQLNKEKLDGVHIAIQGAGNVGYLLAKLAHEEGANITITDVDQDKRERCADEFGAIIVKPNDIYQTDCHVFAPCSLGAVLNDATIPLLNCDIVAGAANNQLASEHHGNELHHRQILYAPDYVINAGGLIHVSLNQLKKPETEILHKTQEIGNTLFRILERSRRENTPPNLIADHVAEEILYDTH